VVDGLRTQPARSALCARRTASCVRRPWNEAFKAIAAKVARGNPKRMGALVGDLAAVEGDFCAQGF